MPIAAWSMPIAGFQMIRIEDGAIVAHGLGDCRLFLAGDDGAIFETSAMKDNYAVEREGARRAIVQAGGLAAIKSLSDDPVVREELRRHRATYNRPGGAIWTLGSRTGCRKAYCSEPLPSACRQPVCCALTASRHLCDQYGRYDPADFIGKAKADGLKSLMKELRQIERTEDPNGDRLPALQGQRRRHGSAVRDRGHVESA